MIEKAAYDKHGHIIEPGYYVKFTGSCTKTDSIYSLTIEMKDIIKTKEYIKVEIANADGIYVSGYWWHPIDAEVLLKFPKEKIKKIYTFDPKNLMGAN